MVAGQSLGARGWLSFPADAGTLDWVAAALPVAREVLARPGGDWRCGGTWFVGVDALPNDGVGAVAGVALGGAAIEAAMRLCGPLTLHPAQFSVTRPGYPQPSPDESETAWRFRKNRDAAHVDGLLAEGVEKRRFVREPHAWVLGIALTEADAAASPLVVWEGSHLRMGRAFGAAFAGHAPDSWGDVDVTDAYQAVRREVFENCHRVPVPLRPGEAVLLHRHLLHGVAPWADGALAAREGRAIAYFRPELRSVAAWAAA